MPFHDDERAQVKNTYRRADSHCSKSYEMQSNGQAMKDMDGGISSCDGSVQIKTP